MDNEFNIEFHNDLQAFLVEKLGIESEEKCMKAGLTLIHSSIHLMYQNAPNKENFEYGYKSCVDHIFDLWKEQKK